MNDSEKTTSPAGSAEGLTAGKISGGQTGSETICAPATIPGTGAISLIRVSGPSCLVIADRVIRLRKGKVSDADGYSLHFGEIYEKPISETPLANNAEGEPPLSGPEVSRGLVDEVLVSVFRAPHSYTGEDMVEISCHASAYIVQRILSLLYEAGAIPAEAGEFTRRAFLNGKMDLSQAEAVADLIASGSRSAHDLAIRQMKGGYSEELSRMRDALLHLSSLMELELDFSEEEVEFADRSELLHLLDEAIARTSALAESFRLGDALKNGIPTAIIGAPNSGKSTLLNALTGQDRAIVSPIAGTTRDTIEECCNIDGILFRFIDTAGLRDSSDTIEQLGIERSYREMARARVILLMLDLGRKDEELLESAREIVERLSGKSGGQSGDESRDRRGAEPEVQELVFILNKADLEPSAERIDCLKNRLLKLAPAAEILILSLADGQNAESFISDGEYGHSDGTASQDHSTYDRLDILRQLLGARFKGLAEGTDTLVSNLRHANALREASQALARTRDGLTQGIPTDLCCQDLHLALHHLGTITGQITTQEVLNNIFSRFCIGK